MIKLSGSQKNRLRTEIQNKRNTGINALSTAELFEIFQWKEYASAKTRVVNSLNADFGKALSKESRFLETTKRTPKSGKLKNKLLIYGKLSNVRVMIWNYNFTTEAIKGFDRGLKYK